MKERLARVVGFRYLIFAIIVVNCGLSFGQTYDTLRVMTYNILNYPGTTSAERNPAFRDIMDYVDPDILVVQEMQSTAGVTEFLNSVLNATQPGEYAAATFINGPDTDNTCFYKPSRVSFISPQTVLATQLRDINGYRLRPVGIGADSLDIQIYSAHLKASTGFENDRFAEADTLRNHLNSLPAGGWLFAAGDFNLYTSSEPAYGELTGSQADNSGRLYDPLNLSLQTQDWSDNFAYRFMHTQSSRVNPPTPDDGGSLGGVDDRFDFMLPSLNFQGSSAWQYVTGSYTSVGQDGNHLNDNINDPPANSVVPDSIADALYRASDHMPVYLLIRRQTSSITVTVPNGGETIYVGESASLAWNSVGVSGTVTIKINRTYPAGSFTNLAAGTANDGLYSWLVTSPLSSTARIQVVSDAQPTISDVSDANFSIVNPSVVLTSPNGGESWEVNTDRSIVWSGIGFSGNVNVQLTRSWPIPAWETIVANSANDGSELWTVNGSLTTTARVRVMSVNNVLAGDTSAANFTISAPSLTLTYPNGGESWLVGATRTISWLHTGLTGDLRVELNRIYPAEAWETLFAATPVATGFVNWMVNVPTSGVARVRITSLSDTSKHDISDANFEIRQPSSPPSLLHDPHMDTVPGTTLFTAKVTDDAAGVSAKLFIRVFGLANFDSVTMSSTGNPNEVTASRTVTFGRYEYFIRAEDIEAQQVATSSLVFMVGDLASRIVQYDDGSAESYQWSESDSLEWAVRFTPPTLPFILSEAEIGIATYHPDTAHQQMEVRVYLPDGVGGTPGTLVRNFVRGSVGNLIGGLGAPGLKLARAILYDESTTPYTATGDVYISVSNLSGDAEAFALDMSVPHAGRSYVFDSCNDEWISEQTAHDVTRNGDRLIRLKGWSWSPPVVVVHRAGTDAILNWPDTGAPYYRVYSSTNADGSYATLEGTSIDTTFSDLGVIASGARMFYRVVSSSQP